MANKVELNELTQVVHNEKNFLTALNENLVRIQKAINDTLSRSGVTPNQMEEVLDMNGKRIINVGDPVEDHDVLTRNFINDLISRVEEAINRLSTLTIEARNALIAYANEHILPPAIAARDSAVASAAAAEAAKVAVEGLYEDLSWIVQHKDELLSLIEHADAMETVAGSIEDIQDIADNIQAVLNSKTWAEGTDEEVEAIGGTHSSKRWAEIAQQAAQDAEEFTGATATADGAKGLVKKPVAGQQNKFLRGDGTWADAGANYTAGTGIDITSNVISVKSPVLQNTATGTDSLTVGGTAAADAYSTNVGIASKVGLLSTGVGYNVNAASQGVVALGYLAAASWQYAIAIGAGAQATAKGAIALGTNARNSEAKTFKVALTDSGTAATDEATGLFTVLKSDGKIPVERLGGSTSSTNNKFLKEDGSWAEVQSGTTYTAGTGIDITNDTISVIAPTLINTATGTNALTVGGAASANDSATNVGINSAAGVKGVSLGYSSRGSGTASISIGFASQATLTQSIAIGYRAQSTANSAIVLGSGVNSESKTFKVSLYSGDGAATTEAQGLFTLLQADGKIPENRIVKQTTLSSASTDNQVPSAKCVYDLVGNVEALINAL